jgi:hypothetical protein
MKWREMGVAALVWVGFGGVGWAQAGASAPYDFKGVQLGITLEEFRAAPIPADVQSANAGNSVSVECAAGRREAEGEASCHWSVRGRHGAQYARVVIGRDEGTASFSFVRDAVGELRLSTILLSSRVESLPIIQAALVERFGPPQQTARGEVVTGLGVSVAQAQITWRSAVSSIFLESPSGSLRSLMVVYEHALLAEQEQARRAPHNPM